VFVGTSGLDGLLRCAAELALVERCVEAAALEQLVVGILGDESAAVEHHDPVAARIVESRWAMTTDVRPANSGASAAWMSCSETLKPVAHS
jgi:hypothetical protein